MTRFWVCRSGWPMALIARHPMPGVVLPGWWIASIWPPNCPEDQTVSSKSGIASATWPTGGVTGEVTGGACSEEIVWVFPQWGRYGFRKIFHSRRILPVKSSCIMPCLSRRVLSHRCSRAASSASMSERTSAMAVCSALEGGNATWCE